MVPTLSKPRPWLVRKGPILSHMHDVPIELKRPKIKSIAIWFFHVKTVVSIFRVVYSKKQSWKVKNSQDEGQRSRFFMRGPKIFT
jgi:hypothetical protein